MRNEIEGKESPVAEARTRMRFSEQLRARLVFPTTCALLRTMEFLNSNVQ